MTALASSDLAWLDDLERAHAAATRGEWYVARRRHMFSDGTSQPGIGETYMPADAALIVAAVNALPTLIAELRKRDAALQAVERLGDEADDLIRRITPPVTAERLIAEGEVATVAVGALRATITAALSPESVQS